MTDQPKVSSLRVSKPTPNNPLIEDRTEITIENEFHLKLAPTFALVDLLQCSTRFTDQDLPDRETIYGTAMGLEDGISEMKNLFMELLALKS